MAGKRTRRHFPSHPASPAAESGRWLYGSHAALAALANPERVCRRLLLTTEAADRLRGDLARAAQAAPRRPEPEIVERSRLDALLAGAVHQGIAVEAEPLIDLDIPDILARTQDKPEALVVALDQISDPQNVGAIMRTAAAFAADALLVTERHAPAATGALAKAASGAVDRLPLARVVNLARGLSELKDAGFWCVGLDAAAERTLEQIGKVSRCVLVLGGEGSGLRRLTRESCDMLARIPIAPGAGPGAIDSLNVSNAAAIALYVLTRQ
jgi:23S rRNA (guanosine2251-2'-O)-methyltransferase